MSEHLPEALVETGQIEPSIPAVARRAEPCHVLVAAAAHSTAAVVLMRNVRDLSPAPVRVEVY